MYESLIRPIGALTATLVERGIEVLTREARDLHKARKRKWVELPQDLYAHPNVQTEWWYYTGHCRTELEKEFGFELVFFKRRTDLDQLGLVPLHLIANPIYAAHFAISEIDRGRFQYEHRRSFGMPLDLPVEMSQDRYFLKLGDWTVREDEGSHILHAEFDNGFIFDAVLETTKAPVFNGNEGVGVSGKGEGSEANHFSLTRMAADGKFAKNGKIDRFTGSAWMDKEFGTWDQKNWDWFSIQLDDGTELMIYNFRKDSGETENFSSGTFIDVDGSCIHLRRDEFLLSPTSEWESPHTGAIYPSGWQIAVQSLEMDLEIRPLIDDQEIDTRGTTMVVYWEGVCKAKGNRAGKPAEGRAYVELVGYDQSHKDLRLSTFFFGDSLRRFRKLF